jgi:hypothetical protein
VFPEDRRRDPEDTGEIHGKDPVVGAHEEVVLTGRKKDCRDNWAQPTSEEMGVEAVAVIGSVFTGRSPLSPTWRLIFPSTYA